MHQLSPAGLAGFARMPATVFEEFINAGVDLNEPARGKFYGNTTPLARHGGQPRRVASGPPPPARGRLRADPAQHPRTARPDQTGRPAWIFPCTTTTTPPAATTPSPCPCFQWVAHYYRHLGFRPEYVFSLLRVFIESSTPATLPPAHVNCVAERAAKEGDMDLCGLLRWMWNDGIAATAPQSQLQVLISDQVLSFWYNHDRVASLSNYCFQD